jgi:16S rRNA processing protein RimM
MIHKKKKYLECAAVVGTHGVRGTVRLENRCDSPAVLASLKRMYVLVGGEYVEKKVASASVQKDAVLCRFEGYETLEDASSLRGTVMYAAREDLPVEEGALFIADLIGLTVRDFESGKVIGTVKDVTKGAAQDIYVISSPKGEFMIPGVAAFIKNISFGEDIDEGVYVSLIEGMAP